MKMIIWLKRLIIRLPFWLPDFILYILQSIIYLVHYRKWLGDHEHIEVPDRWDLFSMCNSSVINYYEFGVASGHSFIWWVKNNGNKDSRFYGYDTFEGLPERWGVYRRGTMASNIPEIKDLRAFFVKGMFQDTLSSLNVSPKIVHIDCDLYNSILFVLTTINWQQGDIIIFDDFNVMAHGFRAFYDWTNSTKIRYEIMAGTKYNSEIIIKIKGE